MAPGRRQIPRTHLSHPSKPVRSNRHRGSPGCVATGRLGRETQSPAGALPGAGIVALFESDKGRQEFRVGLPLLVLEAGGLAEALADVIFRLPEAARPGK